MGTGKDTEGDRGVGMNGKNGKGGHTVVVTLIYGETKNCNKGTI